MTAYYNEIDPHAAAWLRQLIAEGHIAPGVVDERSIEDVIPDELAGFTQCHFFAGIGVWSHALRRAGWPDDYPVWTGSCPCQPFSAAGQRKGFDDERHLWPAFFHLIEQCQPATVLGEQVAGGGVGTWFDLIQADLEAMGYAFGLVALPAAGFGGAHIRDRAFWVADTDSKSRRERHEPDVQRRWSANAEQNGLGGFVGGLADPNGRNASQEWQQSGGQQRQFAQDDGSLVGLGHNSGSSALLLGREPVDWLFCRDARWRPVEAGTFPLADETPARVGRLRGYGNAIDAKTLAHFIKAVM